MGVSGYAVDKGGCGKGLDGRGGGGGSLRVQDLQEWVLSVGFRF